MVRLMDLERERGHNQANKENRDWPKCTLHHKRKAKLFENKYLET